MIRPSTPAAFASSRKRSRAVAVDRVVVAHQHRSACRRPRARKPRTSCSVLGERHAGLESAQARGLDRRPVGHRIGERHAELDHVGAGAGRPAKVDRGLAVGIARADEGDEPARPLGRAAAVEPRARCARSQRHPEIASATVKMSLSPRPHIFITSRWSSGSFGRDLDDIGQRVRRLERGDDALQLAHRLERLQRLVVGDRDIFDPAHVVAARNAPGRCPG